MRPTWPTLSSLRRLLPGSSGTLRGRLSGLLPSDPDDQQPGAGHHEDERSHHADAHDIEAPGVTGKERDGADLLEHEARKATNGPPNQRGVGYVGRSRRLADAAVEDELDSE